jgi:hypothetical protein
LGNDTIFERVKEMIRTHGRLRQDGLKAGDMVTGPGLTGPAMIQAIRTDGMVFVYGDGRVVGINAAEMAEFMPYYVLVQPKTPIIPVEPMPPLMPASPEPKRITLIDTEDVPLIPVTPNPSTGFKLSLPLIAIVLLVAFVMFKKK